VSIAVIARRSLDSQRRTEKNRKRTKRRPNIERGTDLHHFFQRVRGGADNQHTVKQVYRHAMRGKHIRPANGAHAAVGGEDDDWAQRRLEGPLETRREGGREGQHTAHSTHNTQHSTHNTAHSTQHTAHNPTQYTEGSLRSLARSPVEISETLNVEHMHLVDKQHTRHQLSDALVNVSVHNAVDLCP
jgi:hypothetical protein